VTYVTQSNESLHWRLEEKIAQRLPDSCLVVKQPTQQFSYLVPSRCPLLVASDCGWFRTMAAVSPENWTQLLVITLTSVEVVGDLIAAMYKATLWSREADFGNKT
jgi:hypothetical protein